MPDQPNSNNIKDSDDHNQKRASSYQKQPKGDIQATNTNKRKAKPPKRRPVKWWDNPSNTNKILAWAAIAAVVVAAFAIYVTDQHHRQDHRPRIVFSRSTDLLDPLTCDLEQGTAHSGKRRVWLKNIGDRDAKRVFYSTMVSKFVPTQKTGDPHVDAIPSITQATCEADMNATEDNFLLLPPDGKEYSIEIKQSAMGFRPPMAKDEMVQLYNVECVHYSEDDGTHHSTCDTYRLILPNGETNFQCGGEPIKGAFQATISGHCAS